MQTKKEGSVTRNEVREKFQKKKLEILQKIREANPHKEEDKVNFLILGEGGAGKTFSIKTARAPIYVFSFDPQGLLCIDDFIKQENKLIPDERYQYENPKNPFAYLAYDRQIDFLIREGFFLEIGTCVIDSLTFLSRAMMNYILNKNGQKTERIQDYKLLVRLIRDEMMRLTALPCNVILTGHLTWLLDKDGATVRSQIMTGGSGKIEVPLVFTENYTIITKERPTGILRHFQTEPSNYYPFCKSKLAQGKYINGEEPCDYKHILKKVNKPYEDLDCSWIKSANEELLNAT